ncbi:hypothetical protein BC828DRAFT_387116 [Blastocladiella britannica]|nr:hypothetical protein BC828DRAFT_387116 [Blastocladiella britannica]
MQQQPLFTLKSLQGAPCTQAPPFVDCILSPAIAVVASGPNVQIIDSLTRDSLYRRRIQPTTVLAPPCIALTADSKCTALCSADGALSLLLTWSPKVAVNLSVAELVASHTLGNNQRAPRSSVSSSTPAIQVTKLEFVMVRFGNDVLHELLVTTTSGVLRIANLCIDLLLRAATEGASALQVGLREFEQQLIVEYLVPTHSLAPGSPPHQTTVHTSVAIPSATLLATTGAALTTIANSAAQFKAASPSSPGGPWGGIGLGTPAPSRTATSPSSPVALPCASVLIFSSGPSPVSLWTWDPAARASVCTRAVGSMLSGLVSSILASSPPVSARILRAELAPDARTAYTLAADGQISAWRLPALVRVPLALPNRLRSNDTVPVRALDITVFRSTALDHSYHLAVICTNAVICLIDPRTMTVAVELPLPTAIPSAWRLAHPVGAIWSPPIVLPTTSGGGVIAGAENDQRRASFVASSAKGGIMINTSTPTMVSGGSGGNGGGSPAAGSSAPATPVSTLGSSTNNLFPSPSQLQDHIRLGVVGYREQTQMLEFLHTAEPKPQNQLRAKIAVHAWSEALELAHQFAMDPQPVHEARLDAAVDRGTDPVSGELVSVAWATEISPIIDAVTDVAHRVRICLSAPWQAASDVQAALSYALTALSQATAVHSTTTPLSASMLSLGGVPAVAAASGASLGSTRGANGLVSYEKQLAALLSQVRAASTRLGTWALTGRPFSPRAWRVFLEMPLVDDMCELATRGQVDALVVVWRRHLSEVVTSATLRRVLESLPMTIPSQQLIPWLRDYVIPLVRPSTKARVDQWLENRARVIALNAHAAPAQTATLPTSKATTKSATTKTCTAFLDALALLNLALAPVNTAAAMRNGTSLSWMSHTLGAKQAAKDAPTSATILELWTQLSDLVFLHDKLDMTMTLAQYAHTLHEDIATALLDRVEAAELLPTAIKTKFDIYVARHKLDRDDLLVDYCASIVGSAPVPLSEAAVVDPFRADNQPSFSRFAATWEARVLALVPEIGDIARRCDVILDLTSRVSVPWSHAIDTAVHDMLAATIPEPHRQSDLQKQWKWMNLCRMLLNYSVRGFDGGNVAYARQLIKHLATFSSRPEAFDDALRVAVEFPDLQPSLVFNAFLRQLGSTLPHPEWRAFVANLANHVLAWHIAEAAHDVVGFFVYLITKAGTGLHDRAGGGSIPVPPSSFEADASVHLAVLMDNTLVLLEFIANYGRGLTAAEHLLRTKLQCIRRIENELGQPSLAIPTLGDLETPDSQLAYYLSSVKGLPAPTVYRLGEILDIDPAQRVQTLVQKALQQQEFGTMLATVTEFAQGRHVDPAGASRALVSVIRDIAQVLEDPQLDRVPTARVIRTLVVLAQRAVDLANDQGRIEATECYKLVAALKLVHDQTEDGNYRVAVGRRSRASLSHGSDPAVLGVAQAPKPLHHLPFVFDVGRVLTTNAMIPLCAQMLRHGLESLQAVFPQSTSAALLAERARGKRKGKGRVPVDPITSFTQVAAQVAHELLVAQLPLASLSVSRLLVSRLASCALLLPPAEIEAPLEHTPVSMLVPLATVRGFLAMRESSVVDEPLLLGLLLIMDPRLAAMRVQDTLVLVQSHLGKVHGYCSVGFVLGSLTIQHGLTAACRDTAKRVGWWWQMELLGIPVHADDWGEPGAPINPKVLERYIAPILYHTSRDLVTGLEFARDFLIDEDAVMLEYVSQQLGLSLDASTVELLSAGRQAIASSGSSGGSSGGHAASVTTAMGATDLDQRSMPALADYQDAIVGVHSEVAHKNRLMEVYLRGCNESDPYDYDRLQFLLGLLLDLVNSSDAFVAPTEMAENLRVFHLVLQALRETRKPQRATAAIEAEVAAAQLRGWNADWARTRFNYHALISGDLASRWAYLEPFVIAETVSPLVALAKPLGLDPDNFYACAVAEEIQRHKRLGVKIRFAALENRLSLIRKWDVQWSVAMFISENATGNDKTSALEWAVSSMEKTKARGRIGSVSLAPGFQQQLESVKDQLARAVIEEVLLQHALGDEYVALIGDPPQLVRKLYLSCDELLADSRPHGPVRVNEVANAICQTFGLDHEMVKRQLVGELISVVVPCDDDELPSATSDAIDCSNDKVIMHILSWLEGGDPQQPLLALISTPDDVDPIMRLRAVRICNKMGFATDGEQSRVMTAFLHFRDHKHLALPCVLEEFMHFKKAHVQALWLNHRHIPKCPQLICNLCCDFKVADPDLVEKALFAILDRQHHKYLARNLLRITTAYPNIASLPQIWQRWLLAVVNDPSRLPTSRSIAMTLSTTAPSLVPDQITFASGDPSAWAWTLADNLIECPIINDVLLSGPVVQVPPSSTYAPFLPKLLAAIAQHGLEPWLILLSAVALTEPLLVQHLTQAQAPVTEALRVVEKWSGLGRKQAIMAALFTYAFSTQAVGHLIGSQWMVPCLRHCLERGYIRTMVEQMAQIQRYLLVFRRPMDMVLTNKKKLSSSDKAAKLVMFYCKERNLQLPPDADPVSYFLEILEPRQEDAADELQTF